MADRIDELMGAMGSPESVTASRAPEQVMLRSRSQDAGSRLYAVRRRAADFRKQSGCGTGLKGRSPAIVRGGWRSDN